MSVSFKYAFGNFTDVNLVFNPLEKIGDSNYGFRFRTNFDEYDVSVMGGSFDNRIVGGLDFAGNLGQAGVRGEGIISIDKNNSSNKFVKFILGADQQFTPKLYGMIEYQFNGEGKTDKNKYEFARLIKGEILNLNRNYIFSSLSYEVTPLFTVGLSNNTNLNDGSGFYWWNRKLFVNRKFLFESRFAVHLRIARFRILVLSQFDLFGR